MNDKKLRALLTAVQCGSFGKATAQLGYTQSAMTHMVNRLEAELGCTLLVRNALFRRVTLAAREHVRDLGELDEDWGMSEVRWQKALDAYHEQHEEILTDGDARSAAMFTIDGSDEKTDHVWHVHQIFADEDGDHDFGIMGDVDLDATQDGGEVIFKNYRVGFIEDLLED